MSINKILTSQQQDLTEEEIVNLQHTLGPVIGGGLEGYWRPEVSQLGNITWTWSNASTATPPAGMNIKGDKGDTGDEGDKGEDGTSIVLQSVTDVAGGKQVTLAWGETPSTSSFIIPSGTPGTNGTNGTDGKDGKDGKDGTDGTSVYLEDVSTVVGGTQVTLGWGTSDTSAFVIPSGAAGTPGTNGVSPAVTITDAPTASQHPQGGKTITITDADHPGGQSFDIWNGINGQGATVNLVEGNGIKITEDGTNYTIGVSADYALKTELPDLTPYATQTWVGQQGFLKNSDLTDYATKTYANDASAYALSQAETWVETEGYLKQSALNGYATETYADTASAEALSQAKTWVKEQGYLPTSGGTVSGQLIVSGGGNFDQQFLKITRENVNGHARLGLGQYGALALKTDDSNSHTTQVNINPNTTNDQLIQVQHNTNTVGYLIPATTATTTAGLTNDGILHIILES